MNTSHIVWIRGPPYTNILVAQTVKNLLAMQETQVLSLGHEDPLKEEMATHSSVLAWRISGTGEPVGLPSMESHRVGQDRSDLAAAAVALLLQCPTGFGLLCFHFHSFLCIF